MRKVTVTTDYLIHHPPAWQKLLMRYPEEFWLKRGERMMRRLARAMNARVPAYGQFLARSGSTNSRTLPADLPPVTKDGYLKQYPLPDLCWDGNATGVPRTIAATSGSTGEPFYFPRTKVQDYQYAAVAEMYLRSNFSIDKKSTLFIVGWGMGVWIGGVFSFAAVRILAERGRYPVSVITTGISEEEILKAVRVLGPRFDQVIIGGYPPMIKDVIDHGTSVGMSWKKYNVRFIFSAEGFSERFRDYIARHAGLRNIYTDTLNHYGSVDLGTMAHETPLTILVRRLATDRPDLNEALFGHRHRQPTVAQFVPELFYFEERGGSLLCTADSGLPLVRYDLLDTGGVRTLAEVKQILGGFGIDLDRETKKAGIRHTVWNLPFVYVFERSDFTVKFYGANIFPQEIRRALETEELSDAVTGRFTMSVGYDPSMNQRLTVTVELKPEAAITKDLSARVTGAITQELTSRNSEYANNYRGMGAERTTPDVVFIPFGDPDLFPRTGKQRWVRKK